MFKMPLPTSLSNSPLPALLITFCHLFLPPASPALPLDSETLSQYPGYVAPCRTRPPAHRFGVECRENGRFLRRRLPWRRRHARIARAWRFAFVPWASIHLSEFRNSRGWIWRTNIFHAVLNSAHQPLEMLPQHGQAPWVQHQPSALPRGRSTSGARGCRRGARMTASARWDRVGVGRWWGGGEGNLLVLAQDVNFRCGEAELGVGDGGGQGGAHWFLDGASGRWEEYYIFQRDVSIVGRVCMIFHFFLTKVLQRRVFPIKQERLLWGFVCGIFDFLFFFPFLF